MNDEEDPLDSSIHDLDHAPPPPNDRRPSAISSGLGNRNWIQPVDDGGFFRARRFSNASAASVSSAQQPSHQHPHHHAHIGNVKSFPPSERVDRKVGFSVTEESRYQAAEVGMLRLPEVSDGPENMDYGYGEDAPVEDTTPLSDTTDSHQTEWRNQSLSQTSMSAASGKSSDEDETVEDFEGMDASLVESRTPVFFMGFKLPLCCTNRPSWTRVSYFIVTNAPCFWSCGIFRNKTEIAPTDRAILARLNILVAFFSFGQLVSTIFLVVLLYGPRIVDRGLPTRTEAEQDNTDAGITVLVNLWNINSTVFVMGLLASGNMLATFLAVRVIRNVNLNGALRFLWLLLWVIPFEIFFVIALFDYFRVTNVWIKHWWRDDTMAWFRNKFCAIDTADTLCTVPVSDEENEWCMEKFNATNCVATRDAAQADMERWMLPYYYANAAWGLCLIALLLLVVNTLESIISRPLVQKSRESNVPAWMSLPIIGCAVLGGIFSFSGSSALNTESDSEAAWIGPVYLLTSGLFFFNAMLGWSIKSFSILSVQRKRQKLIAINVFIFAMACILVLLITIFSASIAFSVSLVNVPIDENTRADIACFIDRAGGCTNCEAAVGRCPEWGEVDVTRVLQTQAKSSAAMAAIFFVHASTAIRFGFGLRKHNIMYQIDYV